jgi:hypothetical protein
LRSEQSRWPDGDDVPRQERDKNNRSRFFHNNGYVLDWLRFFAISTVFKEMKMQLLDKSLRFMVSLRHYKSATEASITLK